MVEFTLRLGQVGGITRGVPLPPLLVPTPSGSTITLEEVFVRGSSRDIALRSDAAALDRPYYEDASAVDELMLQAALDDLTGNRLDSPVRHLGLLFANFYAPQPGVFGVMFDQAFRGSTPTAAGWRPREGCAVFLDAIGRYHEGVNYEKQWAFTSVHELAHVFNLHHVDTERCFLNSSSETTPPPNTAYHFLAAQEAWLARCSVDGAVHPGLSNFEDFGVGESLDAPVGARRRTADGWTLGIEMPQSQFFTFSPVELQIFLHREKSAKSAGTLADELHPGYRRCVIWIEEPGGERRRYRPTAHYCSNLTTFTVPPGGEMRRDLSIFGEAGGYTFRRTGTHQLWATFDFAAGKRLTSARLEVEVYSCRARTKAARAELEEQRKLLEGGAKTLFYRSAHLRPLELASLERLIECHPHNENAAGVHYALGCAATAHVRCRRSESADPWLKRARLHLQHAAESTALDDFRREKATRRLALLSERSLTQ